MKMKGTSMFIYHVQAPTTIIAMLRPRRQQSSILDERFNIDPLVQFTEYTDVYGNLCQRSTMPVGRVTISTEVNARVNLPSPVPCPEPSITLVADLPNEVMQFILPSRYCECDLHEINMLALEIAGNITPGYLQVEAIRSWIYNNVTYQYGVTDSSTTALDVSRSRAGVCRDFTHLAIALCRNLCIPARMTVGFLDKLKVMDLHAWFEAFVGGEWYTFDSVQERTEGYRIEMAHGRDAADVAMITQYGNAFLESLTVDVELTEE